MLLGRKITWTLAFLFLSGCATIFTSDTDTLTIESEPTAATYQCGAYSGRTPATIQVPRKAIPTYCIFRKEGFEERSLPVTSGIQGVTWIDIFFWPALIADFATGNAYKVEPPVVKAFLDPKK